MKVALVHDYFQQAGGAERVVAALHAAYPAAPIFTCVVNRSTLTAELHDADIRPSWLQHVPGSRRLYRAFMPVYPAAIASLDLADFDVIISSSSAFAKGVGTRPGAVHICYCHTPMRFAWSFDQYVARERFAGPARLLLPPIIAALRRWDVRTAAGVTHFIANSRAVRERIRRCYNRDADVIFPPVEVDRFDHTRPREDFHVAVARLVAYKRIDLAVEAFTRMGRQLYVIGDGPARAGLERAAGPTVTFLGRLTDDQVADYVARARGLVFPGEEDFGIVPLEANAAGCPVIAYAAGGAVETVIHGQTGILFDDQSVGALTDAVQAADRTSFDPDALRAHARTFDVERFRQDIMRYVGRIAGAA